MNDVNQSFVSMFLALKDNLPNDISADQRTSLVSDLTVADEWRALPQNQKFPGDQFIEAASGKVPAFANQILHIISDKEDWGVPFVT